MTQEETIAAVATAPGKGGIGIIRLSGESAFAIAEKIVGKLPSQKKINLRKFYAASGDLLDEGIVLTFQTPNSFTGEDVVEFQGHGGPVILDMILNQILQYGARLAKPGEFSERAFLNDKIDLAQAEAISDLIEANSSQAAMAAQRSLQGEFSKQIVELLNQLIELRVYVEAAIDFPEEEIDFLSDQRIADGVVQVIAKLQKILTLAEQGSILREGMKLVLSGLPNVGKSSLLNRLAGEDSAIVTNVPGTTRDVLMKEINIDGMPLHIIDTAGLRQSTDIVEQEGVRRAWLQIEKADHVIYLVDNETGLQKEDYAFLEQFPSKLKTSLVYNKIDLPKKQITEIDSCNPTKDRDNIVAEIRISAKTGDGITVLIDHLKQIMGYKSTQEGLFLARRRHLHALELALIAVQNGQKQLEDHAAGELLAADLFEAQNQLAKITGEFSSDDLLGEIFSSFCIGK